MCTSIGPHVNTEAVFFVVLVLALVATPVLPMVQTLSVHLPVDPLALVRLPKFGLNCARPMLHVINDLAFVEATPVLVDLLEVGARFDLLSVLVTV